MILRGILIAVSALWGQFAAASGDEESPQDHQRQRRRTPVVEVFEANRDAVVNISSTQIVSVAVANLRHASGDHSLPARSLPVMNVTLDDSSR